MDRTASLVGVGLAASALGWWAVVPAHGSGGAGTPRMVGGGWVALEQTSDRQSGDRARFLVDLPCPAEDTGVEPPSDRRGRLQVTWEQGTFQLEATTAASCSNNLHEGSGTGRCGEQKGFVINWRLLDGDRPGTGRSDERPDEVQLDVHGPHGSCALSVAGQLGGGNIGMVPRSARE